MNSQVNMRKCWQVTFSTYHPRGKCNTLNLWHPIISLQVLHTVMCALPKMVLTERICIIFESLLTLQPFPLSLWPWCLIQGWYCCEKLDACHPQTLKGYLFIHSGETRIPLGELFTVPMCRCFPYILKVVILRLFNPLFFNQMWGWLKPSHDLV